MSKGYYYDVAEDISSYPDAWLYIIVGGRNTGKTYSTLRYCVDHNIKFVYVKRTIKDVEMITAGHKIGQKFDENAPDIDFSPFKALNRDFNYNIRAFGIPKVEGVAGFWKCDGTCQPVGTPIAYVVALSAVASVKGFDLSDCDWIVFDEFIPQPWERVSRSEGSQIMELYKTVGRDREHRGLAPLKLIALANAVSISNPLMNIVEVTDQFAMMQAGADCIQYVPDRLILLHQILDNDAFQDKEKDSAIYKAMGQTNWGQMAFENKFAYDDFTSVDKRNLKEYKPRCEIIYKREHWYVYQKNADFYMCRSRHQGMQVYDLNKENDQKRFYWEWAMDLRESCIENHMKFESYTMYDVIVNYKQFFRL